MKSIPNKPADGKCVRLPGGRALVFLAWLLGGLTAAWGQAGQYQLKSPSGALAVQIDVGAKLTWSARKGDQPVIEPSAISLQLADGTVLGANAKVVTDKVERIDAQIKAINYVRSLVADRCNQITLTFENDFGVIFRAYDDAVAYRFFTTKNGEILIRNEEANFNFTADSPAFIPYLWDYRDGMVFNASFESPYTETKLSEWKPDSYSILPMIVTAGEARKVEILEADLESYPGLYLNPNESGRGLKAVFPRYPLETKRGGYHEMNLIPTKRADYIAKTAGTRSFPWRAVIISEKDTDFLSNDLVQRLASPPRIDSSWVNVGQVAWDWWNDYNLTGVDFKAGMNTPTFKYYIDFAAKNHAKYIIMDGGWSDTFDLNKVNPNVDLTEILAYAKKHNVGVILWASWYTITQQMAEVFPKYAAMGVKGWKIDFIDRDDQLAVESTYDIAKLAAQYKMFVDYHGAFKPTGLQRTYPNVVGYEGVYGLENFKWADRDAPRYAVTIPFIRNVAGPMDYTSGAMRNSTQADFKARNHATMAKGTRCNQLAQYIVFEVPNQMLSDSPSIYMQEQESTDFITSIPTTFDETIPLDGKLAEYVVTSRRKGDSWYVGAMTNWTPRDLTIDFHFLPPGKYEAVIFADGINADREATDYKKTVATIAAGDQLKVHLAPGGGWAAVLTKK
ncbi:MAG TPA: glycoside hydrolase family 97 protein [Opitutaceae bacterium]|jgi:alpha-glucosidase|nr:glycoside hydrolase family 97 protein [Opitutaceae bacterium]